MKPKKSQVSMFIFVGLVLLIIVGFIFYIINYSVKKQTQKEIKTTQKQELRTKSIENFITACLEKTAKRGLNLIGSQGGVIFKDQGGLTESEPSTNYLVKEGTNIWFGIRKPVSADCSAGNGCFADCEADPDCSSHICDGGIDNFCVVGCSFADPDCGSAGATCNAGDGCNSGCVTQDPDCGGASCNAGDGCVAECSPKDPDCSIYSCVEDGMCALGCNPVDNDCAKNGDNGFAPNAPLYPWRCFPKMFDCTAPLSPIYTGYFGRNSLPPLEGINSIKSQLEAFIRNKLADCADLNAFKEQFDISAGAISVDVQFTEKETLFNLNYPLTLKHYKTGEKSKPSKFNYNSGLNLNGIYDYAMEAIKQDTTNINQDITTIEPSIDDSMDSFSANARDSDNNDLITITDSSSVIDGSAYGFTFARENRIPALEMIDVVDVAVNDNVEVLFNKIAGAPSHDPDEDIDCISFTISECDGPCLKADCNSGSVMIKCPTIHNFKVGRKMGGPITVPTPSGAMIGEICAITLSDGELEDTGQVKVTITDAGVG